MTPEQIRALRRAGEAVRKATIARDELICAAVASGAPLRAVGEAVGLSHTAVKFIAHGREPRGV